MSMTKTEKLSHYAIVLIAVMAVVVSVWQVRISQEHNKLSVRPYMDFFYGWNEKGNLQLDISNQGVGPAIIQKIDYNYNGQTYPSWDEMLKAANLYDQRRASINFSNNSPFASGKEQTFLEIEISEEERRERLKGIELVIHYESIYEEKFELPITF